MKEVEEVISKIKIENMDVRLAIESVIAGDTNVIDVLSKDKKASSLAKDGKEAELLDYIYRNVSFEFNKKTSRKNIRRAVRQFIASCKGGE